MLNATQDSRAIGIEDLRLVFLTVLPALVRNSGMRFQRCTRTAKVIMLFPAQQSAGGIRLIDDDVAGALNIE